MKPPGVGDVFVIPVGDGRAGVGQVVGRYGADAYYFAVFDAVMPLELAKSRAVDAMSAPVLLLALSMDAKLHAGHWFTVGEAPVASDIPLPAYKEAVGTPVRFDVVDYSGTRRRPGTPLEVEALPYRKVVAPVRLEKALRAHLALEPWTDAFDELRPFGRPTTAEVFE